MPAEEPKTDASAASSGPRWRVDADQRALDVVHALTNDDHFVCVVTDGVRRFAVASEDAAWLATTLNQRGGLAVHHNVFDRPDALQIDVSRVGCQPVQTFAQPTAAYVSVSGCVVKSAPDRDSPLHIRYQDGQAFVDLRDALITNHIPPLDRAAMEHTIVKIIERAIDDAPSPVEREPLARKIAALTTEAMGAAFVASVFGAK